MELHWVEFTLLSLVIDGTRMATWPWPCSGGLTARSMELTFGAVREYTFLYSWSPQSIAMCFLPCLINEMSRCQIWWTCFSSHFTRTLYSVLLLIIHYFVKLPWLLWHQTLPVPLLVLWLVLLSSTSSIHGIPQETTLSSPLMVNANPGHFIHSWHSQLTSVKPAGICFMSLRYKKCQLSFLKAD